MSVNYVAKYHSGKKYINRGDHIILMKSCKDLIYVTLQEPTFHELIHQYSGNISWDILTLGGAWQPYLIGNEFRTKVIFHNYDEFDYDHHIITENYIYDHYKGLLVLITIHCFKATLKDFTPRASNFICLTFKRHSNDWFC